MKGTMEKIWDKLRERYAENRLEVWLMCAFVLLFFLLNSPNLVREASVLYGDSETELAGESETETESEAAETEPEAHSEMQETETEEISPLSDEWQRRLRRTCAAFGPDFVYPMVTPELEEETVLRTLQDQRMLHGYVLLLPDVQGGEAAEQSAAGLEELEQLMQEEIALYDGDWSVYVKNLSTDESFVINDRPMKSASVMKLFIMGTVYKAFESGELERTDEIMALIHDMITYSDNEDSNRLLYLLGEESYEDGIAKVDAFIEEYGFSDMTVEYNGFNDPATNTGTGKFNQVAARDCGKLLEDIYRRTWVNRAVSNEMEALLLDQNTRYKIPEGLPEGVLCGNKTGEMDTTENDAAIVFAEECDYILVVLSSDWSSKDQAIERIQLLSEMTYEFLN